MVPIISQTFFVALLLATMNLSLRSSNTKGLVEDVVVVVVVAEDVVCRCIAIAKTIPTKQNNMTSFEEHLLVPTGAQEEGVSDLRLSVCLSVYFMHSSFVEAFKQCN